VFIEVTSFFDPGVRVDPLQHTEKPGVTVSYQGTFFNGGNQEDSITVETDMIDFNQEDPPCTLTTLGTQPGCPYRAEVTRIQDDWKSDDFKDDYGPLGPGVGVERTFEVTAPAGWAGMEDTSYEFIVTAKSLGDPGASNSVSVFYIVQATKESMTRYIALEIYELIDEIGAANTQGIKTGGLLPISMYPAKKKIDQALALILNGRLDRASKALSSNGSIMEAFVHALDGFNGKGDKIPEPLSTDWRNRALAIIGDLERAEMMN
jgi:hypothetical protein